MSYFSGCSNFVKLIIIFISMMMMVLPQTSMADEGDNDPLDELWSREELVELAGYGEDKLSTVLITGTVLCQSCSHGESQIRTWPLSGVLMTINCNTEEKRSKKYSAEVVTDEYGYFKIDLPSHLHGIPNLDKACSVNVQRIPKKSACRPTFARKQNMLTLLSVQNGNRIYTAGEIKFQHLTSRPLHVCANRGGSYKQLA